MNLPTVALPKIGNEVDLSRWISLGAPGGAIAISLIILLFIIWPKFTQILQLKSDNQELSGRVQNLNLKAQKLASFDKESLDLKLGASEQLLPSDKGVFSLVTQIERTAATSGVLLNRVDLAPGSLHDTGDSKKTASSSKPGSQADIGQNFQLKVSVTGDYKSFEQFLKNIFSVSRILAIKDLNLSASTSSSGEGSQMRAAMTIDAYWQPLPKELNSIESPIEDLTETELAILNQVSSTGTVSTPSIPSVPTGKTDLFSSF
ncbi:hypothetical protein A2W45_00640 [Candidatus Curtissbacteria bacterium RIFCSPHIGHO2_12_41_11]|uniref:Pilus assembly protein PilO n=3 Tax=Candidatus Curtissiibacteriota TaxID=1752717 RepID=A0A1F5HSW1_9BACT|nr:MAG: hypothetical protein UU56_C0012G0015 [Candidatus Curtissbacteria bacterium GW2011_GWA2_41_24]OGE00417.1 MAG: hypothetical protein A2W45_00640 [Candidatus Curtissbacteria bacterium RIFCSPHIGHO2_12_41_11]OGE07186.1 MAG: hypothetical protein A2W70_01980 [Candidatus Curtissbacteria bacterium RIFCSPLOWO2_02_41_11]